MILNAKLYSFDELILWNFIQCLIKSDYKYLKKTKGFIKRSKLKKYWEDIFSIYMEKSGDNSHVFLLGIMKKYTVLVNKIKVIDESLYHLSKCYSSEIAENLKSLGFIVKKTDDQNAYFKNLKSIKTRAKQLVMEANKLKKEIDNFRDQAGSSEIKEEDFNESLLIMSKNQGYQINSKNITVNDFIILTKLHKSTDGK